MESEKIISIAEKLLDSAVAMLGNDFFAASVVLDLASEMAHTVSMIQKRED